MKEVCVMIVMVNMAGLAGLYDGKRSYYYATRTER